MSLSPRSVSEAAATASVADQVGPQGAEIAGEVVGEEPANVAVKGIAGDDGVAGYAVCHHLKRPPPPPQTVLLLLMVELFSVAAPSFLNKMPPPFFFFLKK